MKSLKDRIKNSLWSFIIGDAFGVPYEFLPKSRIPVKIPFTGYGTHNQPKGTWSDDTAMMLATMDSINTQGSVDVDHIRSCFENWLYNGEYMQNGEVFDIGNTTRKAIKNKEGQFELSDNGNGSLMRMLPIAIYTYFHKDNTEAIVSEVSAITHGHEIAINTCKKYVSIYHNLLEGNLPAPVDINKIDPNGYVEDSLAISIHSLLESKSYLEAMTKAVSFGGDTDTHAAITGSLIGLQHSAMRHRKFIYKSEAADRCVVSFMNQFY